MKKKNQLVTREMRIFPYLMVAPNVILFTLFSFIPIAMGLYYSFTEFKGLSAPQWIGLTNYTKLFSDGKFWDCFWRTWKFALISLPLVVSVPLILALLMTQNLKMKGIFRSILYWPTMISSIVVGLTFKFVFGDLTGVVNYLLSLIGIDPIPWFTKGQYAMAVLIFAVVWSKAGYYMVNYITGLQSVPETYYEAATIDGANGWQRFWRVTIPLIKPTIFLVTILSMISLFSCYALIISLTEGGPINATKFAIQYIYELAFVKFNKGYASAMSMIMLVVIGAITVLQFVVGKGGKIDDE